eukprot:541014-Amphidinium_carterae.1
MNLWEKVSHAGSHFWILAGPKLRERPGSFEVLAMPKGSEYCPLMKENQRGALVAWPRLLA